MKEIFNFTPYNNITKIAEFGRQMAHCACLLLLFLWTSNAFKDVCCSSAARTLHLRRRSLKNESLAKTVYECNFSNVVQQCLWKDGTFYPTNNKFSYADGSNGRNTTNCTIINNSTDGSTKTLDDAMICTGVLALKNTVVQMGKSVTLLCVSDTSAKNCKWLRNVLSIGLHPVSKSTGKCSITFNISKISELDLYLCRDETHSNVLAAYYLSNVSSNANTDDENIFEDKSLLRPVNGGWIAGIVALIAANIVTVAAFVLLYREKVTKLKKELKVPISKMESQQVIAASDDAECEEQYYISLVDDPSAIDTSVQNRYQPTSEDDGYLTSVDISQLGVAGDSSSVYYENLEKFKQ